MVINLLHRQEACPSHQDGNQSQLQEGLERSAQEFSDVGMMVEDRISDRTSTIKKY